MNHSISSIKETSFFSAPVVSPSPLIRSLQTQNLQTFFIKGVGNLRALATSGKDIAWIGGTEGKIAKTEDGGKSWSLCPIPNGEKLDVRALSLLGSGVACAMCAGSSNERLSRVYRTIDQGKTWDLVLSPDSKGLFFNAMTFWNEKEGILTLSLQRCMGLP